MKVNRLGDMVYTDVHLFAAKMKEYFIFDYYN